ncbi:MAG: succinate dehydrogenase [Planctomycetota bacterium]|nr:MAG: succinate dehydrogenase [Planctomycetota bacterium]REJ96126.1 MAG: succinate dehydrogenase [Planctomycetota bacterium]REK21899.1 MAG: succinate dehydrogenase [Planctomycetota bacterium]REK46706.1 MAG: succinate dehydrogenase [Planctomycetota bacterium]
MIVHLLTNSSVQNGPGAFQKNVYLIHSLDALLPLVEWVFIFIPIFFHGIFGIVIIAGGLPNTSSYPNASNIRYVLQRVTGVLAFLFIVWHVFHMHGWIHADWWIDGVAKNLGGAQFKPYNAASTAGLALQSFVVIVAYVVGVLACVFHLANGIWTMGITWGAWTSPAAQRRANAVCTVFGVGLAVIGLAALQGMWAQGRGEALEEAIRIEDQQYNAAVQAGILKPNEEKRAQPSEAEPGREASVDQASARSPR